jgi:septal ring factor EnvC (AmiA/AmiB activator)
LLWILCVRFGFEVEFDRLYFACKNWSSRCDRSGWGPVFLVALALPLAPAAAKDAPREQLKAVEKALEQGRERQGKLAQEAEALGEEVAALRAESVAAARAAQQDEAALSELEDELARLSAEEREKSAALQARAAQQVELLMALQRLALAPPEALLFAPGEPVDAARSAMLLGAAVPRIEEEAKALEQQVAAVAGLREQIEGTRGALVHRRQLLEAEQAGLAGLIQRKSALQTRLAHGADATAQRVELLSAQASDLRDLLERLEAERKRREAEEQRRADEERRREAELLARARTAPPRGREPAGEHEAAERAPGEHAAVAPVQPQRSVARREPRPRDNPPSLAAAGANLTMPVSGRLVRRWNELDESGMSSKGLAFQTRPGAQVVAPSDGRIEFAGPFRGYGQILIIEHGDGYHSLLAGLDRIDGAVGQSVIAGEPVGVMKSGEARSSLYFELRRNGQPINPMPWLATRDEKVSG